MALRCYNCGNEPGDGEACIACGAPQTITPVGMFTLRPDPEVTSTDFAGDTVHSAGYESVNGSGDAAPTSVGADIVDAAVVEDGIVIEPASTAPPPYVATSSVDPEADRAQQVAPPDTYAVHAAADESAAPATSSILDGRPSPSELHDPMRSPFGQHATAPPTPEPVAEPEAPPTPARHGIFSAGTADPVGDEVPATTASRPTPSGPPPAFVRAVPAGPASAPTGAPEPAAVPFTAASAPDAHGLSASVSRLSAAAQQLGHVPFSIAGALLGAHEHVLGAVAGTSLGMPTAVVVTQERAIIVSDRRYVPDVEIFDLGPGLTIHGRHANDQASLTFTDSARLITVDQIVDVGLAVELANTARNRTAGGDF